MFDSISITIAGLTVAPGCAAVADALAGLERLRAKIVAALVEIDRAGEWAVEGDTSLTAWLKRQGLSTLDTVHLARAAVGLRHAPVTAAAYETGALSGAQIDAVFANVRPAHRELFADHETDLVPVLAGLSPKETADAMQAWRQYADAVLDERAPRESELSLSKLPDGRRLLRGDLSPRLGRLLETALRLAHRRDLPDEPARTATMRRADALEDICSFFLDHRDTATSKRHRPHVHVGIDLEALRAGLPGETLDGEPVDPVEIAVLACDADVRRVLWRGRSSVLDFGHVTRIVPKNLARAAPNATGTAGSPAATGPPTGATCTTSSTGTTTAPPRWPTCSCSAAGTTTSCTGSDGASSSTTTPPSPSPCPTGASAPPDHHPASAARANRWPHDAAGWPKVGRPVAAGCGRRS